MYLTFSNLNSIHWIIKKDIGLYVLFRTFQVNFQDISVTPIYHGPSSSYGGWISNNLCNQCL